MKPERSSWVIFALSFLISLAILGAIVSAVLFFSVRRGARSDQPSSSPELDLSMQNYTPSGQEDFTLLIIGCNERNLPPAGYLLLHLDAPQAAITLIPLPKETASTVGARTDSLNGHYDYAGSEGARLAAEAAVLAPVDRYVRISKAGVSRLVDALGGLELQMKNGFQGSTLSLPPGKNRLNGDLFCRLASESQQGAQLVQWILTQRCNDNLLDRGDTLFQVLLRSADTNISYLDFSAAKKPLRFFLRTSERSVSCYQPDCVEMENGLSTLTKASTMALQNLLSRADRETLDKTDESMLQ